MFVLFPYLQVFISNIIIFLLLTLVIATITLMERKILSLVQRRVGPNYIGYRGRLQFIADAVKLLVKHILIVNKVNKLLFLVLPATILIICYLFWINLIWAPNLAVCEIEYNLLFMGVLSMFFSFLMFLVGWVTKNKYAILSSTRVLIVTLNLEVFLNFFIIYILSFFESFSFFQIVSFQNSWTWTCLLLLPILPILFIIFFLETGRIPFDLGEAESELVAGHTTEMGGFFFALFYLGEYFHLFCFSVTYTIILFGGWHLIVIKDFFF
jgi:NADH-quinone oxidoreductase subunit H